jgi:hypothetical protein
MAVTAGRLGQVAFRHANMRIRRSSHAGYDDQYASKDVSIMNVTGSDAGQWRGHRFAALANPARFAI